MKRITNHSGFTKSAAHAKKVLRTRHLQTSGDVAPAMALLDALVTAYPESQRVDSDGQQFTDWQDLAWRLALDFVPAFQGGKAQGRPRARMDGLVECVDALVASGEANGITHACHIVDRRGLFPGVTASRPAYYRRRKLLR